MHALQIYTQKYKIFWQMHMWEKYIKAAGLAEMFQKTFCCPRRLQYIRTQTTRLMINISNSTKALKKKVPLFPKNVLAMV